MVPEGTGPLIGNPIPLEESMLLIPEETIPGIPADPIPGNPGLGNGIPLPSPHIIPVPFPPVGIETTQSFELGKPIIGIPAETVTADVCRLLPATSRLYCCKRCCCSSMEADRGLTEANLCTSLAVAPTFRPTDEATKPVPNCTLFVPCNRVSPADMGCIPEAAPRMFAIGRPLAYGACN